MSRVKTKRVKRLAGKILFFAFFVFLSSTSLGQAVHAQATSTTGGTTSSTGGSNSTVSLSALSTDLRTSGSADIDTAKVASIKAALNDGSYKVDSGKIADGMLSSTRELMQTNTPPAGG